MNIMNISDNTKRKVRCRAKYDTSPFSCPFELLEIGKEYTVIDIDVHSWFTNITLEEFPDEQFNSVLFEEIKGAKDDYFR